MQSIRNTHLPTTLGGGELILALFTTDKIFKKTVTTSESKINKSDFPGGTMVKSPPANAGDTGSSPGPGRSHMPRSN